MKERIRKVEQELEKRGSSKGEERDIRRGAEDREEEARRKEEQEEGWRERGTC